MRKDSLILASRAVEQAVAAGADAADAIVYDSADLSIRRRMGALEALEREESCGLGLRVMLGAKEGYRQAIVSTNDMRDEAMDRAVEHALAIAKYATPDRYAGLADPALVSKNMDVAALELFSPDVPDIATLEAWVAEAEDIALQTKGITNSDGAEASTSTGTMALATSHGFAEAYRYGSTSLSVSVIAGEGTLMETDYDYAVARFVEDLPSPQSIGQSAADRALKRLNPVKKHTARLPVVFDWRVARSLLSNFASAINGASVARGTSFLKDAMGTQIFGEHITIMDDPLIPRALGTEPFDAEGIAGEKRALVKDGVLQTWLLDTRSANQLGLKSTGHAGRGLASPPSPGSSNLYLQPGKHSVAELLSDIKEGFYVTDTFGMGVNGVTGDYSQGAAGFWIENGEITHSVSEMTIAGTLQEMFTHMTPANDLVFRFATNSPTLRIEGLTVAGV